MSRCITSIEPDLKDPNQRNIYVNGDCVATISATDIEQLGIKLEQVWDNALDEAVEALKSHEQTRTLALQLLSRRSWSNQELAQRLAKRGCDPSTATTIVSQLNDEGWLDDLTYASSLIREWIRSVPASRRWLQHKLSGKGIDECTSTKAIEEELGERSEQDTATEVAAIRIATLSSADEATARRRVISAVQRRGFSADIASEAFRRVR